MAKTVNANTKEKKTKAKTTTMKDNLFDCVGQALANGYPDYDVLRVKPINTPEGILITDGDKDYYLVITEKQKQVEYLEEDVKRSFLPEDCADEQGQETEE